MQICSCEHVSEKNLLMLDGDTHTLNKLSFGHFYILKVVWLQSKVATLYSRRIKLFFKTILPTSYIVCFGLD